MCVCVCVCGYVRVAIFPAAVTAASFWTSPDMKISRLPTPLVFWDLTNCIWDRTLGYSGPEHRRSLILTSVDSHAFIIFSISDTAVLFLFFLIIWFPPAAPLPCWVLFVFSVSVADIISAPASAGNHERGRHQAQWVSLAMLFFAMVRVFFFSSSRSCLDREAAPLKYDNPW